jgi:dUTPase
LGYRNEIGVIIENNEAPIKDLTYDFDENHRPVLTSILHGADLHITKGERFAQLRLVKVPHMIFHQVDSIDNVEGDRGGGFGSTD